MKKENTEKLREAAWQAHGNGDCAKAEGLYRESLKILPDVRDAVNLGALLRSQGRLKEACTHYAVWLKYFSNDVNLLVNAANAFRDAGELIESETLLMEGLRSYPEEPRLLHGLAKTWINRRKTEEALRILANLKKVKPNDISIAIDLGICLHCLGRLELALQIFQDLSERIPEDCRFKANCITILREMGRLDEALELIKHLSESARSTREVKCAHAQLLMGQNREKEAVGIWLELCYSNPEDPLHWLNLAACLKSLKNMTMGFITLKEGYKWHPEDSNIKQSLGQSLAELGTFKAAMKLLSQSIRLSEGLPDNHLFNLQFLGAGYGLVSSEDRKRLAIEWENRKTETNVLPLWEDLIREPIEGQPMKIGYLSADFCNHPVGRFMLPILKAHQDDPVEIWIINCGKHRDEVTDSIRATSAKWIDIRFKSDQEAARMLSDLGLDVIVELGGYTADSRLGVLMHKPAPIQLSYLGYFAPTYLKCIDGWIGDHILFKKLNDIDRSSHRLIKVSGGYMCLPANKQPKLAVNNKRSRFRFGSFNNSRKITSETVKLWSQLLRTCKDTDLLLKSVTFIEPQERSRIRRLFLDAGIKEERIVILPWADGWIKHMQCYEEMDVALDPIPYGGATTSTEALIMGVPIVCLHGEGMVGALTASILHFSGLGDHGIASNIDEYIRLAYNYAHKGRRGLSERAKLREKVLGSPLANPQRMSRELIAHYKLLMAAKLNSW